MEYTYSKLKGKIKEVYGTQGSFAKALGLSENSLSNKLNGKIGLSQEDIELWSELLHIDKADYASFYFA